MGLRIAAPAPLPLRILVSYAYGDRWPEMFTLLRAYPGKVSLVIDCGAFTAWTRGKKIELDAYCRWLDKLPVRPDHYFALDVVGDAEATARNWETMLARGYRPVPIFTRGQTEADLEAFFKESELVALGGLFSNVKGSHAHLNAAMKIAGKRKVHWLGYTELEYLRYYRPFMCDSSSWVTSSSALGMMHLYLGLGKWARVNRREAFSSAAPPPPLVRRRLDELGLSVASFGRESEWHSRHSPFFLVSVHEWMCYAQDLELNLGTRFYFASTTTWQTRTLLRMHAGRQAGLSMTEILRRGE